MYGANYQQTNNNPIEIMKTEKYHANGKPITKENPKKKPSCPKCKSHNVTKNGNLWDCLFCGELFN